jgi:hypothetical protein
MGVILCCCKSRGQRAGEKLGQSMLPVQLVKEMFLLIPILIKYSHIETYIRLMLMRNVAAEQKARHPLSFTCSVPAVVSTRSSQD